MRGLVPCCDQVVPRETRTVSRAKRIFAKGHSYHINSIAVNSDQQTFLSADDLRINLWSLEVPNRCFNMLDIKPDDMATLSEVCSSHGSTGGARFLHLHVFQSYQSPTRDVSTTIIESNQANNAWYSKNN